MINQITEFTSNITEALIKGWKTKNQTLRIMIVIGTTFLIATIPLGFISGLFSESSSTIKGNILAYIYFTLLTVGTILILIVTGIVSNKEKEEEKEKINNKEKEVAENPKKPKLAWDLARIKLESYLTRNEKQVKAIFQLSIFIFLVGFGLIIYGAIMIYKDPTNNLKPSILVAVSGIILNFIGTTFIIIYKSTMAQAKNYVLVLERINAVGMSVQIIDTIDEENKNLKNETKAELAKKLIDLYTEKNN